MDLHLSGLTAVVTGGSSGIGLETVRILLEEGANVVLCARNAERLQAVAAELTDAGFGARILAQACDVLDQGQVEGLQAAAAERFGRVDILIANAGQGRTSTFQDTSDADWDAELHLKVFSVVRPVRAFLPMLRASGHGSIVVVNSLLARQPEPHMVCTSAARAGVQNLVKSMSVEFAPEVRVNSILLGTVNSGQWARRYAAQSQPGDGGIDAWLSDQARQRGVPAGRMGRPQEPAAAIVFLCSPISGFTTGAALEVSGGVSRFA